MQLLTVCRAAAWIGAVTAASSLSMVWGPDVSAGKGPPGGWQPKVVGAFMLAVLGALVLLTLGRRWKMATVATALATAGLAIAVYLKPLATAARFPHLLEGPGWPTLLAGTAIAALACGFGAALSRRDALAAEAKARRKKSRR